MSAREVCKYYLHGACRNGPGCRFAHGTDAPKSTVCSYYLAGNCAYGDRCRYDHVRPTKVRWVRIVLFVHTPHPPTPTPRPE